MSNATEHQDQNMRPVEPATSSNKYGAWDRLKTTPAATATFVGKDLEDQDWLKPAKS